MFSYRHSFHAGSHADVLKHLTLMAILRYLSHKETPFSVIDTHAGAGLYRLDSDHALTSQEAQSGVLALLQGLEGEGGLKTTPLPDEALALLTAYRTLLARFNSGNKLVQDTKLYPGSPLIAHALLRARDKLRLYELHPSDYRLLLGHVASCEDKGQRQISVRREDGFEALGAILPPTAIAGSRRALILIDPSYEIKSDYAKVEHAIALSLQRFPTGCYAVWYPIIPRPQAHSLPRRLKTLAHQAGKPFLKATLNVGRAKEEGDEGRALSASGMFIINPPHTLKATLNATLPAVLPFLARGWGQSVEIS